MKQTSIVPAFFYIDGVILAELGFKRKIRYNDIGIVQKNLGNYDQAIDNYLKALRRMEELKDK